MRLNRDILIPIFFIAIAYGIYTYFDNQQHEKVLKPIKDNIIASQKPLVLHFYANWCAPCRSFEPILRGALRPYGDTIDCQDLNIDIPKNWKLLHSCGAGAIPTTVIFDRQGNQIAKEVGVVPAKELDIFLRKAALHNKTK